MRRRVMLRVLCMLRAAIGFVGGLLSAQSFRMALGLGLMTVTTLILCQVRRTCVLLQMLILQF